MTIINERARRTEFVLNEMDVSAWFPSRLTENRTVDHLL